MQIKLEWILSDSNWCDGCPFAFVYCNDYPWWCSAGFWQDGWEVNQARKQFFHLRPQECKDKFGA